MNIQDTLNSALALHQSGKLAEAQTLYRQILAQERNHCDALHLLGVLTYQAGQPQQAIELIDRAIAINPSVADYHVNLGVVLAATGKLPAATFEFQRAVTLRPDSAEAHANLGNALRSAGKLNEAVAACQRAVQLRPDHLAAHVNLGHALQERGDLDQAIAVFARVVALKPDFVDGHQSLGNVLFAKGEFDQAAGSYRVAATLRPSDPQPQYNLGLALAAKGDLEGAVAAFTAAITRQPQYAPAHAELGNTLRLAGHMPEASQSLQKAIALDPKSVNAINNLGNVYKDMAKLREAIDCYQKAVELDPGNAVIDSNRIYTLLFDPDQTAQSLLAEHKLWNKRHAEPLVGEIRPHGNDRSPDRRLKIGYVSPHFRDHVVGLNILPLLREQDRHEVAVYCYSNVNRPDLLTRQFRVFCEGWRDVSNLDDTRAAQLIRDDGIDILVDLALHLGGNRLPVFARKPAPVQATFAGYPGGTGMPAMDWRLTDPYLDPPGETDGEYVERSLRLPDSFWCYDPHAMGAGDLDIAPPPAERNGYVTLGCLNNFCKINDRVLNLWAMVMRAVPTARLLVLAPQGEGRRWMLDQFGRLGVPAARLDFRAHQPRRQYLAEFHSIDLCLDTLPYSGHTTSLDSFWMGVPVATRVGRTVVGRSGASQLHNLGLNELAAHSDEQFVKLATDLASDIPRLRELRRTLRDRMLGSPLTGAQSFARGVEAAYRQMWKHWCKT
jgi:protein O-GlcNAc transferase